MANLEYSPALGGFVPFGTVGTATATVAVAAGDALFVRNTGTAVLPTGLPAASLTIGGLAGQAPVVILPEGASLAASTTVAAGGVLQLGQNTAHPNAANPALLTGGLTVARGGQALIVDGALGGVIVPTGTIEVRNNATLLPTSALLLSSLDQPLPIRVDAAGTLTDQGAADTATLMALLTNQDSGFNPLFNGQLTFSGTLDNTGSFLPLSSLGALTLDGATVHGGTISGGVSLASCVLQGVAVAGTLTTESGRQNTLTGTVSGFGTLAVDGTLALGGAVTLDPATLVLGANGRVASSGSVDFAVGPESGVQFGGGGTVLLGGGSTTHVDGTLDIGSNATPVSVTWSSPGGSLAISADGSVHIGASTSFVVDAAFSSQATISLDGGTLDVLQTATLGTVNFLSAGSALMLGKPGDTGTLLDFADGSTLLFAGAADIGASAVLHGNTLDVFSSSGTLDGHFVLMRTDGGSYREFDFNLGISGFDLALTTTGIAITACYAEGTRLATPFGARTIETIRPGELLCTADGGRARVVWTGRRRLEPIFHPRPWDVSPIRVRHDAFGPGLPARDLVLSPDHAVFVEGVLIPVRYLCNGATVVQEAWPEVTYWHIELERHAVVLAEGLPAESYLDTGNRAAFEDAGSSMVLHPAFARAAWEESGCAPLMTGGEVIELVRAALAFQAGVLGHHLVADAALRVVEGTRGVRLLSRSFVPAEVLPGNDDHRRLGIAVTAISIDGEEAPLDDARLGDGWYPAENGVRWTSGEAEVAGSAVTVETQDVGAVYWEDGNQTARYLRITASSARSASMVPV